ncbi:GNAT family N-acetyltransferase [Salinibacterium metalliresistens]|uniref:GNAT family N-acetyltransferase n=1 Tax=Salinibacterium metalliresistens TaxID=3031321 RepID=UPI003B8311DC
MELSYEFVPERWGHGFAREACVPVLRWAQREVTDGTPIIAVTQAANTRSLELLRALGMVERERFVEFGAPQVLMVWSGEDSATVRWGHDGVSG